MAKRRVHLVARFQWELQARLLRARVPEFIALHPELDLTIDIPPPEQGISEKVIKSLAQGQKESDILDLHTNFEVPLVVKGNLRDYFLDLTDRVAAVRNQFVGWEPCTWHGRVYGLPSLLSGSAYYYRPDAFNELGIDPATFETWDDFIRAGLELKKATGSYMLALDTSGFNQFQPLALHAGGGWFNRAGELTLGSEPTIRALELYRDLLLKYQIAMPIAKFYGADMWQAYSDGRVVGAYMPEWYGANELRTNMPNMAGKFRITLAPAFEKGGPRSGYRGGMCASVIRGPDEDIAYELLSFTRLNLAAQVAMFEENFLAPSMRAAYAEPAVRNYEYAFLGGQRVAPVYAQIAQSIQPFCVSEQLLEVQQAVNQVIPQVTAGHIDPRQALERAAADLPRVSLEAALKIDGDNALRRASD